MADAITIQALQDASLDAKSLEEVVNGNEVKQVTTRKGETYPSVKKAIKTLFENGGLPAEPFATKAKMETDGASLADGQLAQVYNEAVNNGLYVKTAGAWVKSAYDPVGQSKEYTNAEVNERKKTVNIELGKDTHAFTDAEGNILARISGDGGLHLIDLGRSVQDSIVSNTKAINDQINSGSVTNKPVAKSTHTLTDADGNILFDLKDDGKAYFVGLDTDLVGTMNAAASGGASDIIKSTELAETRGYKNTFIPAAQSLLNNTMYAQTGAKAPPPIDFFPQNFSINKTWVNNILPISHATSTRITIDTPYFVDDGVVHPHIVEFYNGFRGYRYIVALTPYRLGDEQYENPCIYGSNDLIAFDLLDGFEQPLDPRPTPAFSDGHNSDPVMTYDPRTGELICVWRQSLRDPLGDGARSDALWMRKTKDGYTWTNKERIFLSTDHPNSYGAGSQAILYDVKSDYWYMYVNTLGINNVAMQLYKAKSLNESAWVHHGGMTLPFNPWHQDVRFVGDKIVMMVYEYPPNDAIYVGISDNFTDFTWSGDILAEDNGYKASFVPIFDANNNIALKVLYTTNGSPSADAEKWRMYSTTTNFINAGLTII